MKNIIVAACLIALFVLKSNSVIGQNDYKYSIDLNQVSNDTLNVELITPLINNSTATFSLPKIIPGTYSISDYGKFVTDVKAYDRTGRTLQVTKLSDNKWKISRAADLRKITYKVTDIFDTDIKHNIYPMAATNFEQGKNFVLHTPGYFGYFDGFTHLPLTINVSKPDSLYGSTSLEPVSQTSTRDVFKVSNIDELYDAPIMYSVPDTTTIRVGNSKVLVSVYSPGDKITSKEIAGWMNDLLEAARLYLGGKLPADKYAFLYYFKDPSIKQSFAPGMGGALEHTTSSFYYLPDLPASQLKSTIVHVSSHEFFHIITPLTIASKEIKEFNYNEPVLSQHLWLYEGVTEYTSYHVQVKYGLQSTSEFLNTLSEKITSSRKQYNDTLPFTILSKGSAGVHEKQYGNVYEKGALIAASLDLYLLHLSDGTYGLKNLTHDLGIRYGRTRFFNDQDLFKEIGQLTYPEVQEFLEKHVAGSSPIPYEYYFGLAGIQFIPNYETNSFSLGGIAPYLNKKGVIAISPFSQFNDFGKKLGYVVNDELYAINGINLTVNNIGLVIDSTLANMKEGEEFTVLVGRQNAANQIDTMLLRSEIIKVKQSELNKLLPASSPTPHQKVVQDAWLNVCNNPLSDRGSIRKEEKDAAGN